MLTLILFIGNLFSSNINTHPPKPEPEELECGLTERQVERMVGPSDRDNSCWDEYSQLIYGKNIMFFKKGYLVGQIKIKDRFEKCYDLSRESGFNSLCEDE